MLCDAEREAVFAPGGNKFRNRMAMPGYYNCFTVFHQFKKPRELGFSFVDVYLSHIYSLVGFLS